MTGEWHGKGCSLQGRALYICTIIHVKMRRNLTLLLVQKTSLYAHCLLEKPNERSIMISIATASWIPIIIKSQQSCLRRSFFKKILPAALCFTYKNLVCKTFDFRVFFSLPIHWYWKWFEFKYSDMLVVIWDQLSNQVAGCSMSSPPIQSTNPHGRSTTVPIPCHNTEPRSNWGPTQGWSPFTHKTNLEPSLSNLNLLL